MSVELSEKSLQDLSKLIASQVAAEVAQFNQSLRTLTEQFEEKLAATEARLLAKLDDEVKRNTELRETIDKLSNNLTAAETEITEVNRELEQKEQYGRRMNVRFQNIEYDPEESEAGLLQKLTDQLAEINITIKKRDVVCIHRLGKPATNDDGIQTMPTICKFAYWKPRQSMNDVNKRARSGKKSIRAHADLTKSRFNALKYAQARCNREQGKRFTADELKGLRDNQKCFAFCTPQCELRFRCNGVVYKFQDEDEFDDLFTAHFTLEKE